ncbi:MAG: hypothetical protein CMK07_00930 [Ponticaulis sp.]|nr:hypothetical protein [Ponticaulis sp.]
MARHKQNQFMIRRALSALSIGACLIGAPVLAQTPDCSGPDAWKLTACAAQQGAISTRKDTNISAEPVEKIAPSGEVVSNILYEDLETSYVRERVTYENGGTIIRAAGFSQTKWFREAKEADPTLQTLDVTGRKSTLDYGMTYPGYKDDQSSLRDVKYKDFKRVPTEPVADMTEEPSKWGSEYESYSSANSWKKRQEEQEAAERRERSASEDALFDLMDVPESERGKQGCTEVTNADGSYSRRCSYSASKTWSNKD